jgi:hypothetical protein
MDDLRAPQLLGRSSRTAKTIGDLHPRSRHAFGQGYPRGFGDIATASVLP